MDPGSAIIGFVTTGIQVVRLVKKTIDDIKNAPKDLQDLRDRAADIEASLKELERRQLDRLFESEEDMDMLERTGRRAKTCLDEISTFMAQVQKTSKDGGVVVDKFKWVIKGDKSKDLLEQLNSLDTAVKMVITLVISRSQSRQERSQIQQGQTVTMMYAHVLEIHQRLPALSSRQPTGPTIGRKPPTVSDSRAYLTPSDKLSCPLDCACRCHSPLSSQIVPQSLVPWIGQMNVSKRILHAIGASSWECNIQTCRRDKLTSQRMTWVAQWWYLAISISSNSFTTSLHAPRVIPLHAPVWVPLNQGDVDTLQAMFVAGEASVHDVSEYGDSLFYYACRIWAQNRSEDAVKVIRFLKDAGADPDFTWDPEWSVAQIIFKASLATLIEHPASNFLHVVRTSQVAVDICRSILNVDVVDVLDDYLSHPARRFVASMLFRQPGAPEDFNLDVGFVFRACGWRSMITYSMWNMPEDATLRLIQSGREIPPRSSLPIAVDFARIRTVKALIDAGADVNGCNDMGFTALHEACESLRLDMLELLAKFAGKDIDWTARTPKGENAIQIAKRKQLVLHRSPSYLKSMFDILRAHIPDVDDREGLEDRKSTSYAVPGAFPTSDSS